MSETSAERLAVNLLKSVDLPTFGRPTMAMVGGISARAAIARSTPTASANCARVQLRVQLSAMSWALSVSTNMRPPATTGAM